MRWHYRDAALLWLFVPAYLAHLAEELWAGESFPAWLRRITGEALPVAGFVAINGVALICLVPAIHSATRRESAGWIAVALGTIASLNALLHLAGTIVTGVYSPGLITGVVVWIPLGTLTLLRAGHQMPPSRFGRGIAAGLLVHSLVFLAALAWSRLAA